jgi:hypothetical protein
VRLVRDLEAGAASQPAAILVGILFGAQTVPMFYLFALGVAMTGSQGGQATSASVPFRVHHVLPLRLRDLPPQHPARADRDSDRAARPLIQERHVPADAAPQTTVMACVVT